MSQPRKRAWLEVSVAGRDLLVPHTAAYVVDVAGECEGVVVGVADSAPAVAGVAVSVVVVGVAVAAVVTSS